MANVWFLSRDGRTHGPFRFEQLQQMTTTGQLLPVDLLAQAEDGPWVPAIEVRGLFDVPQPATPPNDHESPFDFGTTSEDTPPSQSPKARPQSTMNRMALFAVAGVLGLTVIGGVAFLLTRNTATNQPGGTPVSDRQGKAPTAKERESNSRGRFEFDRSKRFSVAEHHNAFGGDRHYTKTLISQKPWIDLHCWQVGVDIFACLTTFTDLDVKPWTAYEVKRYEPMTRKQVDDLKKELKRQYGD